MGIFARFNKIFLWSFFSKQHKSIGWFWIILSSESTPNSMCKICLNFFPKSLTYIAKPLLFICLLSTFISNSETSAFKSYSFIFSTTGVLLHSFPGIALLICWVITSTNRYRIEHQLHAVDTGSYIDEHSRYGPIVQPNEIDSK